MTRMSIYWIFLADCTALSARIVLRPIPHVSLGQKLIKYQRQEGTKREREKKRRGVNRAPVWYNRPYRSNVDRALHPRRIKRAWASTFLANSAFDDLRPWRIEPISPLYPHPSFPLSVLSPSSTSLSTDRRRQYMANTAKSGWGLRISLELITPTSMHTQIYARTHFLASGNMHSSIHDFPLSDLSMYIINVPLLYGKIILPYRPLFSLSRIVTQPLVYFRRMCDIRSCHFDINLIIRALPFRFVVREDVSCRESSKLEIILLY